MFTKIHRCQDLTTKFKGSGIWSSDQGRHVYEFGTTLPGFAMMSITTSVAVPPTIVGVYRWRSSEDNLIVAKRIVALTVDFIMSINLETHLDAE